MKNNLKIYLWVAAACCLLAFGNHSKAFGQQINRAESLKGELLAERLKQSGEYNSLAEAVAQVRREDEQTESPQATHTVYRIQAKLTASDGAADNLFGNSVAISGDTAVVGAPSKRAAYIFVRTGTNWTQQKILTGSDSAAGDRFGISVSISGNTVIVGADSANNGQGAAYIFVRSGTSWGQQAKLTASDGAANDHFGISVAVSGANAIVGAFLDDIGANSDQGSAYTFVLSGTIWIEEQKLFDAGGGANNYFGLSVALSGTTAIVASYYRQATFVYVRSGNNWNLQQTMLYPAISVAISGDTAVLANSGDNNGRGVVRVFARSGTTWTLQQTLNDPNNSPSDYFGGSVSIFGDTIVAGAGNDILGDPSFDSSAYIYTRLGTTWTLQTRLIVANSQTTDAFGGSVGISSGTVIVGAALEDTGGNQDQGSAYIYASANAAPFDFDGDGKSDVSVFRQSNGYWYLQNSMLGFTYAGFGLGGDLIAPADYDGDGKTDLAVFRPSNGAWYLQRSILGFTQIQFGQPGDLPMPADFDGDGKAEIAIFRPSTGAWYTYNLANGQTTSIAFGINGDTPTAADYDGDGKADIAVFRPSNGTWYLNRSQLGFTAIGFGANGDKAVPGDYDGDGKADLAVWRPSNGYWYLNNSSIGFTYAAFGITNDLPAPADYDGDGKTDLGIFRPSNGSWYLQRTTQGFTQIQFGANFDKPAPNAFVP